MTRSAANAEPAARHAAASAAAAQVAVNRFFTVTEDSLVLRCSNLFDGRAGSPVSFPVGRQYYLEKKYVNRPNAFCDPRISGLAKPRLKGQHARQWKADANNEPRAETPQFPPCRIGAKNTGCRR